MFAYCGNNPVTRVDAGGVFWDIVLDVVSLVISVGNVIANPDSAEAWIGLGVDVVCTVVPFVTGGGLIVKAATKADDIVDASRTADNLIDAARNADNISDTSTVARASDDLDIGALCFVAGTPVLTEDGSIPIEEIEIGDYVWAWDEESGQIELQEVLDTYVNYSDVLVHLVINGEEIVATPSHPFYVPATGWLDASELEPGDTLFTYGNDCSVVEAVWIETLNVPVEVFNLNVNEFHTYYISDIGVLVHNNCANNSNAFDADKQAVIALAKEYKNGIDPDSAEILVDWAMEYGISSHGIQIHPERSGIWSYTNHIKIKNIHIKVE